MTIVARFIGVDEVVSQYRKMKTSFFSMWCKTAIVCQYNGDDIEEGEEMIKEEIERNIKRGFAHECFLKIHPDFEKVYTLKSAVLYNVVFKSFEDNNLSLLAGNSNGINYALMNALNGVNSRLAAIEDELNATDDDDDDDDDVNGKPVDNNGINGMLGQVTQLMDHPVISKLIEKFLSPTQPEQFQQPQRRASFAGTGVDNPQPMKQKRSTVDYNKMPVEKQQALLQQAIEILLSKGVTLSHFIEMSKMPESKIQMLLTLL